MQKMAKVGQVAENLMENAKICEKETKIGW